MKNANLNTVALTKALNNLNSLLEDIFLSNLNKDTELAYKAFKCIKNA